MVRLALGIDPYDQAFRSSNLMAKERLLLQHVHEAYLRAGGWAFQLAQHYGKDSTALEAAKKIHPWGRIPASGLLQSASKAPPILRDTAGKIGLLPSTGLEAALDAALFFDCGPEEIERIHTVAYDLPDDAEFSRDAIHDWLTHIGWPTKFDFAPSKNASARSEPVSSMREDTVQAGWPWGNYETKLLRLLPLAYEEHWKNYDPSKPETAPKSDNVTSWLVSKHKAPQRVAEVIAQLLRADELPSGPRQKGK